MSKFAAHFIARYCRWLTAACLLSLIIPILYLGRGRVDNSIEVWVSDKHPSFSDYRKFLQRYGNEEFIVVATEWDDPLSESALEQQRRLAARIKAIEGIESVMDLSAFADRLSLIRSDWKEFMAKSELLKNLLLSSNGRTGGLIAWLGTIQNYDQRRIIIGQVESAVQSLGLPADSFYLAGTPVMNVALDRGSQLASMRFLPAAIAASIVLLLWMLRSIAGLLAVLCSVISTVLWTVGLMFMAGKTMNMVTIVLPPLLFVLSLAGGIHLIMRFKALYSDNPDNKSQAIEKMVKELLFPVFLTCMTTGIGFASLMTSDMKPVQDFGEMAAIGMMLSFGFNFLALPGVLSFLYKRVPAKPQLHLSHWTQRCACLLAHKRKIVAGALLLTMAFAWIAMYTKVDANVLGFFPKSSKIQRDYRYISQNLTGLYSFELDITVGRDQVMPVMNSLDRLSESLASLPDIAKVVHYGLLTDFILQVQPVSLLVADMDPSKKEFMKFANHYFINEGDQCFLRMSILIRAMSGDTFERLLPDIQSRADSLLAGLCDYKVTGIVPLVNDAQKTLILTQVRSLSLAMLTVFLLIGLGLRSFRAFLAALLPNLLPVLAIFSYMVFFGIVLDGATVMIAGIAIGIAVDDTIHFLTHYRQLRPVSSTAKQAVESTFGLIGRAVTITSITATFGFSILLLAPFKPIFYFGLLGSLTMATAWIGDVAVLPVCADILKLWEKP